MRQLMIRVCNQLQFLYSIYTYLVYINTHLQYLHDYYKNADDQVDNIYGKKYFKSDIPLVNFDKNRSICSTVLSGHKFPGAPWPCGVYMTRHKYQLYPPSSPMYIGSMDSTLSGSRNGLSPVILWYYLSTHSDESISKLSYECFELAKVVQKKIEKIIHDKKQQRKRQILQDPNLPQLNLIVTRAPFAISLVFSQVIDELTQKYTLALQQLADQNDPLVIQTYNHYFLMQSLQRNPKTIEAFLQDLAKPKSFKEQFKTKFVKQQNHQQFFAKVKYSLGHGGW